MKSIRKFVALMLMIWTPLFFSGASYAATQMEIADATSHAVIQKAHACHEVPSEGMAAHHEQPTSTAHCQHCSFCVSFAAPLYEMTSHVVSQTSPLAFNALWAPTTYHITPDHRPPIDA